MFLVCRGGVIYEQLLMCFINSFGDPSDGDVESQRKQVSENHNFKSLSGRC